MIETTATFGNLELTPQPNSESIPAAVLADERAKARAQGQAEGKPENIVERIVEGRLAKFTQESCLMLQPFVKEETLTVGDLLKQTIAALGENVVIRRFARWELGEDL